jgi:hypothetical protein
MRDAPDNATPTAHGFACEAKSSEQPLAVRASGGGAPTSAGKLTVFTSEQPATLGKVFSLKADGGLDKEVAGHMVVGTYEVHDFANAADLAALLSRVTTSQAISASLPLAVLPQSGRVVSSKLLWANDGAVTRSKSNFEFRSNTPGVLTIDYDPQPGDGRSIPGGTVVLPAKHYRRARHLLASCSGSPGRRTSGMGQPSCRVGVASASTFS